MIGKITIGKSFRGCIAYCLNDKIKEQNKDAIKNRAEVLMFNKCFGNEKELVQEFNEVRQLNMKLSKPVLHVTLSLAPGENLSRDKLMEMTEHCAKDLGFENNQYIAIAHSDTNHQHLHIVANRIGFDKRTVSDSNNYQKLANYCRKMEIKYELTQVLNPKRYLPKEQRNNPRYDQRKENLRAHVKDALKDPTTFLQFEQQMKERGYQIIKGRGISFTDEKKVTIKGSEVNYSLQTIEKIIAQRQSWQAQKQNPQVAPLAIHQHTSWDYSIFNNNKETVIDVLLKRATNNQETDKHFLQHKRKKKKSQHL